jgi:hypothetical protein
MTAAETHARRYHGANHWSAVPFERCSMTACSDARRLLELCGSVEPTELAHVMDKYLPAPRRREGDQDLPVSQPGQPSAHDGVCRDVQARKELGQRRYGSLLQPFNGRDGLRDAYEESLDLAAYLRREQDEQLQVREVVREMFARLHEEEMRDLLQLFGRQQVEAVAAWARRGVVLAGA